jgi:uncharacterized membrane protein YoaK (UPF0700 family)
VLLLSLTAGSADALGYLSLGNVFTSNMTGNVVLLGIHLGQGKFELAARGVYVLSIFVLGLGLGAWLSRKLPEKKWPVLAFRLIGLEKILLLLFGISWLFCVKTVGGIGSYLPLALLAVAMGLQSAAMFRLSAPGVGTTAVTGTLTALTSGLVARLSTTEGGGAGKTTPWIRFQLSVLFLYATGAALSGFCLMQGLREIGFLPALAAAFVSFGRSGK